MKRPFYFTLVLLVLLGCLTACTSTKTMSGMLAGDATATPKVEEMMVALATDSISDAKSLMHPKVSEKSDNAIAQMSAYLAGREASSIEQQTISVNTSSGTSGKTIQEQVSYRVTLTDGEVVYLNVVHLTDTLGTGFHSFQLVLGVV